METRLGRPLPGDRVHFVAIGGVGMAALAELLVAMGYRVSGSDLKESRAVRRLAGLGARVWTGRHRAEYARGAQHVVVSAAVPETNAEVRAAREAGVEVLMRAELLGRIFDAGRGVAVTGTHGKTTTSSMLAMILQRAGLDPSFVIGGDLNDVGSGAHLGLSDLVVAEADEAFGSFLHLTSELALVTNVDVDHLDHYGEVDAIGDAFTAFLAQRRPGGTAVVCSDDPGVMRLRPFVADPVVTYGTDPDADLVLRRGREGWWRLGWRGSDMGTLRLSVPGMHNVLNAAGAAAAAMVLGADPTPAMDALASFSGVERRFSVRGVQQGVTVVDDYAHNPRKVAAALQAARERYPDSRVIALFQPHLYSRTQQLAAQFGEAFNDADIVVVTDVYGARETPLPGVSGRLVWEAVMKESGPTGVVLYAPLLDEAAGLAAGMAEPGDVILTLGAGDVTTAAPLILELLRQLGSPR